MNLSQIDASDRLNISVKKIAYWRGVKKQAEDEIKNNVHDDDKPYNMYNYWYVKDSARRLGYVSVKSAVIGLYRKHKSIRVAGEKLGLSHGTTGKYLRMFGEKIKGKGGANFVKKIKRPDYISLKRRGYTGPDFECGTIKFANLAGISIATVRNMLRSGMPYRVDASGVKRFMLNVDECFKWIDENWSR